jgi:hypothetical protein
LCGTFDFILNINEHRTPWWLRSLFSYRKLDAPLQSKPLSRNESGRFGALKSDSAHHFFRNACTKSGSLRFSQFSGCWLILSVYIIMSFDLFHAKQIKRTNYWRKQIYSIVILFK